MYISIFTVTAQNPAVNGSMQYRLKQLLPLYNALYCASVAGSVSEIYLN